MPWARPCPVLHHLDFMMVALDCSQALQDSPEPGMCLALSVLCPELRALSLIGCLGAGCLPGLVNLRHLSFCLRQQERELQDSIQDLAELSLLTEVGFAAAVVAPADGGQHMAHHRQCSASLDVSPLSAPERRLGGKQRGRD